MAMAMLVGGYGYGYGGQEWTNHDRCSCAVLAFRAFLHLYMHAAVSLASLHARAGLSC